MKKYKNKKKRNKKFKENISKLFFMILLEVIKKIMEKLF